MVVAGAKVLVAARYSSMIIGATIAVARSAPGPHSARMLSPLSSWLAR